MVPPKNFNKDDDLPSDGKDDNMGPKTTGASKVQVNTMPDANAFLPLVPDAAGGGNASVSTIPSSSTAHYLLCLSIHATSSLARSYVYTDEYQQSGPSSTKSKPPPLEMRKVEFQVMRACPRPGGGLIGLEKLEADTIEFESLLKLNLISTMALTGFIAANPAMAGEPSVQSEVKMVEAMSTYLQGRLGDMPDPDGGTAEEQARREEVRTDFHNRIEEIKKRLATRRSQPGWSI